MRVAPPIKLLEHERRLLVSWVASRRDRERGRRAKVILLAAGGLQNKLIARAVELNVRSVSLIRRNFLEAGLLAIETLRWSRVPVPSHLVHEVVRRSLEEAPPAGARWSTRSMADAVGLSPNTVSRIWRARGIKPHAAPARQVALV